MSFSNCNLLAVVLALITDKRSKYTASMAQCVHITVRTYNRGDPLLLGIK